MNNEKRECENCEVVVEKGKDGFYVCAKHRDERGFNE